jgi:glycosyltransferase involved in cell wall biosynthesis
MKIVHLTAHLGGGIGKAVSDLVVNAPAIDDEIVHQVVSFEKTQKTFFSRRIEESGVEIIVQPDHDILCRLINDADIVQLEWWNHPATLKALCRQPLPPMRLIIWCHVSGLFNPIIPPTLIQTADRFLFTSPCSYDSQAVKSFQASQRDKLAVVSSCGGFNHLSRQQVDAGNGISVGYFGSLNFSKLHPDYIQFLKAATIPGLTVKMIGDVINEEELELQCQFYRCETRLEFAGYAKDPGETLSSLNVLAYLLNPEHYGTTENALLEAMAMGVVPIVLDNPAERHIVEHLQTGLVVRNAIEFNEALHWLDRNPDEHMRISETAAKSVRKRYTKENLVSSMHVHYMDVMAGEKKNTPFTTIFGKTSAQWFLSCQAHPSIFVNNKKAVHEISPYAMHGLFEQNKGTVYHFSNYFPDDRQLKVWAEGLRRNHRQGQNFGRAMNKNTICRIARTNATA